MVEENEEGKRGGKKRRWVGGLMGRGGQGGARRGSSGRENGGGSSVRENGGGNQGERGDGRNRGMDVGQKGKSRVRCGGDGRGGRCGAG